MYGADQTHTASGKPLYDRMTQHEINVRRKLSESQVHEGGSFEVLRYSPTTGQLIGYTGPMSADSAQRFTERYGGQVQMIRTSRVYNFGMMLAFGTPKNKLSEFAMFYMVADNTANFDLDFNRDVYDFLK